MTLKHTIDLDHKNQAKLNTPANSNRKSPYLCLAIIKKVNITKLAYGDFGD